MIYYHKDSNLTFREHQTINEVHRYLFQLLVGDDIRLEKTKITSNFHLIELASVTFYDYLLNIGFHFQWIKAGGDITISFVETLMIRKGSCMPMLKILFNKRRARSELDVIFKKDGTIHASPRLVLLLIAAS
jgi:hypothetical protein